MDQKLIADILQAEIQVGKKIKQHQNNLKQFSEFNTERAFEQLKKFSINSFNTDPSLAQSTLKNSMNNSIQGIAYKGVIDFERLIALYRQQDELVTPLELQSIIQRYSSAANQGLDYDAFLRIIGQNLADTKRRNLIFDSNNNLQSSKNGKTLSERVMQALSSIFLLELDLLRFTEVHKVSLKNNFSFEPISFFTTISFNSSALISFEHLQQFFRRNGQEISKEDYLILLNRVKKSKQRDNNSANDECITQQEFVQLTVPQLPYNSKLSMAQLRASQSQGNLVQSEYVQASQSQAELQQTKSIVKAVQFQEGHNTVLKQSNNDALYVSQFNASGNNNGMQYQQSSQKLTNNNNANIPINNGITANKLAYGIPVIPVPIQANQQYLKASQQQQQVQSPQGVLYIPPQNVSYYPVQQQYAANNNITTTPQYVIQQNPQQQQIQQLKADNVTISSGPNASLEAMNDILKTDNEKLKQENSNLQQKILQVQQLEQRAKDKEALRAEIIAEQQFILKQQQEQQQLQAEQQQQVQTKQQQQLQATQQQIKPNPVVLQPQQYQIVGNRPVLPFSQGLVQKQHLPYQQQQPQVILSQGGLVNPATFTRSPIVLAPAPPVMATSMLFTPQQPGNPQIIANQLVQKTCSPITAPLPEYILNQNQAPSFLVGGQQFNNRPVLENAPFARGMAPHYNPIQGDLREAINNQFGPPQQPSFIQQQNIHGFGEYSQF